MEDISLMFYNFTCTLLISIPDIFKWNKHNLKFMSKLFYNCSLLMSISAIFELDYPSVYDISELFYNCSSLEKIQGAYIPRIPKIFFYNNLSQYSYKKWI